MKTTPNNTRSPGSEWGYFPKREPFFGVYQNTSGVPEEHITLSTWSPIPNRPQIISGKCKKR